MDIGVPPGLSVARPVPTEPVSLPEITRILRDFAPGILAAACLAGLLAVVYARNADRIFISTATLLVDPANSQLLSQDVSRAEVAATAAARIDSQAEVIKSSRISQPVIASLRLSEDPEFQDSRVGLTSLVMGWFNVSRPAPSMTEAATPEMLRAQVAFANRLGVRRVGQSLVLEISFQSRSAEKAALVANSIAEAYISEEVKVKSESARAGSVWLQERLDELRGQTFQAMRNLEQFRLGAGADSMIESNVRLAELESVSQTYRKVYEIYLQRFTETVQTVSYPVASARVIAPAVVPLNASYPKTGLMAAFAAVMGGALGLVIQWTRRMFDRRLRTRKQVTTEIGVPCLGIVPRIRPAARADKRQSTAVVDTMVVIQEELREVRTAINQAAQGRRPLCIGITSVGEGEGKSLLAMSLARLFALSGARTLLVDACAAHPTVSRELAREATQGLLHVLRQPDLLQDCIVPQPTERLYVLPVGMADGPATFSDLIDDSKLRPMIAAFDLTIVDLPALSPSADARAFAPCLDGLVLVAAYRGTSVDRLSDAVASLRSVRASVFGIVVNDMDRRRGSEWG